ncbi:MAG: NADAR domain-containing protein [Parachlamydia sp.]|jgi:serine/threonine protein phosphatase PrpC/predicted NAD-dependent protein-ADP-ribosyltransferase YbiA (DUF1768 family)|nr:NADAR domain-containing protein [Parachlamydia sp.]
MNVDNVLNRFLMIVDNDMPKRGIPDLQDHIIAVFSQSILQAVPLNNHELNQLEGLDSESKVWAQSCLSALELVEKEASMEAIASQWMKENNERSPFNHALLKAILLEKSKEEFLDFLSMVDVPLHCFFDARQCPNSIHKLFQERYNDSIEIYLMDELEVKKNSSLVLNNHDLNLFHTFLKGYQKSAKDVSSVFVPEPFECHGKEYPADWYSQQKLSKIMGFDNKLQKAVESVGGPFVFVLSFSNVHASIHIKEPTLRMPDPYYDLDPQGEQAELTFPSLEYYFQTGKRIEYILQHPEMKDKLIAQFREDLKQHLSENMNTLDAYKIGRQFYMDGKLHHLTIDLDAWNKKSPTVMKDGLFAKFKQNPLMCVMLLLMAEDPRRTLQLKTCPIYGPGADGHGKNLLGSYLDEVRDLLLKDSEAVQWVEDALKQHNATFTYQYRLDKNLQFAIDQQRVETDKGFKLNLDASPDVEEFTHTTKEVWGNGIGIASARGKRKAMEDEEIAEQGVLTIKGINYPFTLLGVFDGHGKAGYGKETATFVKDHIMACLEKQLALHNPETLTQEGIFKALKKTFMDLEKQADEADAAIISGTTASVALILENKIWLANVGDSRVIGVTKEGVPMQLTEDATPEGLRYKTKIEKLGGIVEKPNPASDFYVTTRNMKIEGKYIGTARAIGDLEYCDGNTDFPVILCHPKISCVPFEDFSSLVIGCDGLFDKGSTNEVGAAVDWAVKQGLEPEGIAKACVEAAYANGSTDNITVMVAKL